MRTEKFNLCKSTKKLLTLITLLTLGVGQIGAIGFNQGNIFFDATGWGTTDYVYFAVGKDSYTTLYQLNTHVENTNLYRAWCTNNGWWDGCSYFAVLSTSSSWGSGNWGYSNVKNASCYTGEYTSAYDINSGDIYVITKASSSNGAAMSIDYKSGITGLNSTQTVTVQIKTANAANYSNASKCYGTSISATTHYFNTAWNSADQDGAVALSNTTVTGNASAALSSTVSLSLSGTVTTGYQFDGWYYSDGTLISTSTSASYIVSAATTVYARFSEKMSTVTLTASPSDKGSFTIGGAAATSTSVGVTTTKSVTAVPASGYHFVSWAVSGGATISNTTDNPVTVTGTGAGTAATLTATFAADDVYTLTVAAGTGISSVSGTTNNIKAGDNIAIDATVASGYSWSTWTKTGSGSLSAYTAGTKSQTVTVGTAGDMTLTASATEIMRSITINGGTAASTTAGVATTGSATAAAPAAGKKFTGWTLGTGVTLSGGALTDRTINFTATANSSVTANYADRASVKVYFAKPSDWTKVYAFAWKEDVSSNGGWPGVEMTSYETVGCVNYYYYLYYTEGDGIGGAATGSNTWDQVIFNNNSGTQTNNLAISNGHYYYKADATASSGRASALASAWFVKGDFNSWGETDALTPNCGANTATKTISLTTGDKTFKIYNAVNDQWWRIDGNISATIAATTMNKSEGNMTLTPSVAGNYTFTVGSTNSTPTLAVTYPTSYTLTYSIGSVAGASGSITSSPTTASGSKVLSGNTVILTAPAAKTGYTWKGWYGAADGSGYQLCSTAAYTVTMNTDKTLYACYTINNHAITHSASTHGSYTIQVGSAAAVSTSTTSDYGKTIKLAATPATGYHFGSWSAYKTGTPATTVTVTSNQFTMPDYAVTVGATFAANTYSVTFDANGGTGDAMSAQAFTYDVAQALSANTYTRTGYDFDGWATAADGAKVYDNEQSVSNLATANGGTFPLFAHWTAKSYTVTLDKQTSAEGYGGNAGTVANQTVTFDATPATVSGTMPTAAQGYGFMGFYSEEGGNGRRFIDPSGNWVTSAGDTISEGNWVKPAGITLYAYYKKAEITALTFDAGTVEPGATVGVTPTIEPTPEGQKIICWTILYNNDTPLAPQPEMTWDGSKLTFNASAYSGTYKVQAVLRTGDACGAGDPLDTETASFLVAGSHSVTVNYKCSSDVIKTATSVTGRPTEWSDDITAPDIFGYTFSSWSSADGVTIKDSENEDVTSSTDATIKIKATYAGSLTANYTQNQMIFFKNTLGWENVYVNFYTASDWDNTDNGSGYPKGCGNNGLTNRNKTMTQYGETDIWYYDYEYNGGSSSITPTAYISFTDQSQNGVNEFWASNPGINVVYPANYADAISTDKSSENGFKAATPMFVPIAAQDPVLVNVGGGGRANYYNAGYWSKYTPGTGYVLEVYNSAGDEKLKTIEFESADDLMPMKAVADLEGGTTYKFQVRRGGESSAGVYYGNKGTMTYTNHGQDVAWDLTNTMSPSFTMAGITANAAGDYTFNLSYSAYHNESTDVDEYRLRIAVDYPVASGDYRLVYTDDVHTNPHPSAIVNKVNDGTDIVSFFVRHDQNPVVRIQQATVDGGTGEVTWNEYPSGTPTNQITGTIASTISSSGTEVYNFNLSMNGSGALTVASAEVYDGNFYIRTDAASSKWDNYRTDPDHRMIYSEYSITHGGYTHYYTHWVDKDVTGRKNVKFCIANDYSPCISDTLAREEATGTWEHIADFMEEGGDLKRSANVRYMWDKRDNTISRAYVDGAQTAGTQFLTILSADEKILNPSTSEVQAITTFSDKGNWMYEANIKAKPGAQIKLKSSWGKAGETDHIIDQYFRGASDATEQLIGGSGSSPYDIRAIYDFKSNRLIAGLIPSGTIDEQMAIHADVMFVREHHGNIAQLTFAEKDSKMGAITDIETAYGVLQFNKWTINNKSKDEPHNPLSPLLSQFERDLFYVSFPFKVAMEDVFGFGTYGQHWIIEYYDGASRATNGYWAESGPNWKFVTNRKGKYFEPGQGYIIALDLDEMGESADIWANTDRVELYFPSYGTMDNITSSTATYEIPEHECTINRSNESNGHGGTLGPQYDRRVKDSHWNVLGVPTYVNPEAPNFANTDWTTEATETSIGPNFLYQWSMTDNTVSPVSASGYTYQAMHAYLVQYCGDVTWTSSVSVTPTSIVARRTYDEAPRSVEFRLELTQNDVAVDQTFVKLSDNEAVTTGFEFNYDLSKEFNKNRANIYTLIGTEQVAGNVLPLTDQTTVVPVGVKISSAGDYTFSLPDGTNGVGIILIDNVANTRTNLSVLDYTVNLTAGTYDNRFVLEISPIHNATTDIEAISDEGLEISGARKVLIDGILYIVKGDKLYDVRGTMIK